MRQIPPYDSERTMGRPPLKPKDPTVKTTIRLTESLLRRVRIVFPDGEMSNFLRKCLEAEVERREASAARSRKPSPD